MKLSFRRAVQVRRGLILTSAFLMGFAGVHTQHPLLIFAIFPLMLMIYVDQCLSCGHALWFAGGARNFADWLNPLFLPRVCPKCREPI